MPIHQSASEDADRAGRTILIVEDDTVSARALQWILTRYGWNVVCVETVAAAQSFLDNSTPYAIVLDLMLPDGEGTDILDRIRRESRESRVAVTTAATDPARVDRVHQLQPEGFFQKPLDLKKLLDAL